MVATPRFLQAERVTFTRENAFLAACAENSFLFSGAEIWANVRAMAVDTAAFRATCATATSSEDGTRTDDEVARVMGNTAIVWSS